MNRNTRDTEPESFKVDPRTVADETEPADESTPQDPSTPADTGEGEQPRRLLSKATTFLPLIVAAVVLVLATVAAVLLLKPDARCVDSSLAEVSCSADTAYAKVLGTFPAVPDDGRTGIAQAADKVDACPSGTFNLREANGEVWCLGTVTGDRWADHSKDEFDVGQCLSMSDTTLAVPSIVDCGDDPHPLYVLGVFPIAGPPVTDDPVEVVQAYVDAVSDVCPVGSTFGPSFFDWKAGASFLLCAARS